MFTPEEVEALILSLKAALASLCLICPFGIVAAWVLVKTSIRGKSLINTVVMLPLVLPPVVSGYLLLMTFSRRSPVGELLHQLLGIDVIFSFKAVVLAVSLISFPLMVRAIMVAMEGVDSRLEKAAHTLGAGRLKVFFTVTLPLSYRGILSGIILGFSKSLGEFGATMMVAGNIPGKTQTIPLAIYNYISIGQDIRAFRLVFLSTILAFVMVWLAERFSTGRRSYAISKFS